MKFERMRTQVGPKAAVRVNRQEHIQKIIFILKYTIQIVVLYFEPYNSNCSFIFRTLQFKI